MQTIEKVASIVDFVAQFEKGGQQRSPQGLAPKRDSPSPLVLSLPFWLREAGSKDKRPFGLKLLEQGKPSCEHLDLRNVAEPLLRDLAEKVKETVHVLIMKIESERDLGG